MVLQLSAQKLVEQVRQRAVDEGSLIWTNQKILDAADLAFGHVFTTIKLAGSDHELDKLTLLPSDFTRVEDLWYEYTLPEWVGSIRLVEGVTGNSAKPILATPSNLEQMNAARTPFLSEQPRWIRSGLGRPGSFSILGEVGSLTNIRVWFIRSYPPLHYGTAASGSTTTIGFASVPEGTVIGRDGLYVGMDVLFTNGTLTDQIRRITGYVGATKVATFSPALATPVVGSSTTYSLLVPLETQHSEYFVEEVTRRMLSRLANLDHLRATEPQYAELRERFLADLRARDIAAPKRMWSKRR